MTCQGACVIYGYSLPKSMCSKVMAYQRTCFGYDLTVSAENAFLFTCGLCLSLRMYICVALLNVPHIVYTNDINGRLYFAADILLVKKQ